MMHSSPDAAALARALLALSRASQTGVLTISSGGRQCRLALQHGCVVAATSTPAAPTLGDILLQAGEFDRAAHAAALSGDESGANDGAVGHDAMSRAAADTGLRRTSSSQPPREAIGAWLIAAGVTSAEAIERALARQVQARLAAALRLRDVRHHFQAGPPDIGVLLLEQSRASAVLLMAAACDSIDARSLHGFRNSHPGMRLVCSAFGRALLREGASFLSDRCVRLLQNGASIAQLSAASGGDEAELRNLAALVWLAAVVPASDQLGTYALLLRKQRQVQQRVSAAELLDLDPTNHAFPTRRALRRLASRLHPDVLGPSAPAELREASTELMRALVHAEGSLRAAK
jgi:hypothetical protein